MKIVRQMFLIAVLFVFSTSAGACIINLENGAICHHSGLNITLKSLDNEDLFMTGRAFNMTWRAFNVNRALPGFRAGQSFGLIDVVCNIPDDTKGSYGSSLQCMNDYDVVDVGNGTPAPASAPAPVPEPATMLLLGAGLIGLAGFCKKKIKE